MWKSPRVQAIKCGITPHPFVQPGGNTTLLSLKAIRVVAKYVYRQNGLVMTDSSAHSLLVLYQVLRCAYRCSGVAQCS